MQRHQRLILHDGVGVAALALVLELAHADDGDQARFHRRAYAQVHGLVGLAEVLAALAVADDHILHATGLEHVGAEFARIGAALGEVDVLRAQMDVAALGRFLDGGKVRRGHAHHHVAVRVLHGGHERGNQLAGFVGGLVHLPVAGNDRLTHGLYLTLINHWDTSMV